MPTPDIIKVFREKFVHNYGAGIKGWKGELVSFDFTDLESFILQALTDREAEIVAGIEGMETPGNPAPHTDERSSIDYLWNRDKDGIAGITTN